jgi:hypothetical protein
MTDSTVPRGWPNLLNANSQDLAAVRPRKLLLRTGGVCDLDPQHLLEVFGQQQRRRRFIAVLQGFGPSDWAAPTRCHDWSAHKIARHLCDANAIGIAARANDGTLDVAAGVDPRVTPSRWLAASAGESPGASLGRLAATTEELLMLARERLAQGRRFDVRWVFTYGDHPRRRPRWNHPTAGPSQADRRTGS